MRQATGNEPLSAVFLADLSAFGGFSPSRRLLCSAIFLKMFFQKLHQLSVRGAFLRLFCRMTLGEKQEKTENESNEDLTH